MKKLKAKNIYNITNIINEKLKAKSIYNITNIILIIITLKET